MSQNELKFKLSMDEAQFEQEAEKMARSMDKMYERSYSSANSLRQQQVLNQNVSGIGIPTAGSPTNQAFKQATDMGDRKFKEEVQQQMAFLNRGQEILKQRAASIAKLEEQQKKLAKGSAEHLALEEKITKQKENQNNLERDQLERQSKLNEVFKNRSKGEQTNANKIAEGFSKGGVQGAAKTGLEMVGGSQALLALGVAGAAAFAIRQLTNAADAIIREVASVGRVTATATGNAIAGSSGQVLAQVYGGRSAFETGNAGERSTALRTANEEEGTSRGLETVKSGDISGVPGLRNNMHAQAASIGWGGFNALLGDDMQKARFFGRFSDSQMKKYNAMSMERMVKNYNERFEAEKAADPMKQLALGQYEGTYMQDLGTQRKLGLGDQGLHEFKKNYLDQGFTHEQGQGAMNNIIAAGGSTRMAKDPSMALNLARGGDLTNADSALGKLSGSFGDAARSKAAMIEILSEGTRVGLNKSEFREEQRKFTEAAASFLSSGYGGTDADMARQAQIFGSGLSSKTGAGISAASNTADIISGVSSSGSGPEGALGFSSLMGDDVGRRLSDQSQQSLNTMSLKDATEDNARIISMAQEASTDEKKVSPQDIIKLKMQSVKDKLFRNKDMQNATEEVVRLKDSKFKGMSNKEIAAKAREGDPDAQKVLAKLGVAQNYVATAYSLSGDQTKLDSLTDALGRFGQEGYEMSPENAALMQKQLAGESDRTRDQTVGAVAHDQSMVNDKTQAMLGDFSKMAETSKSMSAEMVNAFLKIQEIAVSLKGLSGPEFDSALKKRVEGATKVLDDMTIKPTPPTNQPQGGKK